MSKVALSSGENPGNYSIGGWMGPRADVNDLEKRISPVPAGIRTPDRPPRRHRKVVIEYFALEIFQHR
jgi:hypothetical protein